MHPSSKEMVIHEGNFTVIKWLLNCKYAFAMSINHQSSHKFAAPGESANNEMTMLLKPGFMY